MDLKRKKDMLYELVKARAAVKRKYDFLKFGRESFERAAAETFKPIIDPLEKLVNVVTKDSYKRTKENDISNTNNKFDIDDNDDNDVVECNINYDSHKDEKDYPIQNISTDRPIDASFKAYENIPKIESEKEEEEEDEEEMLINDDVDYDEERGDKYMNILLKEGSNLDKIYGVRKEWDEWMLGNALIYFEDRHVKVKNVKYPKTRGLMTLIICKDPDRQYVTAEDIENYRSILEASSAHKRRYRNDESLRPHNSKKFSEIIAPMFSTFDKSSKKNEKKQGGHLPKFKIARKNTRMDYVYWDDPNELVDRLQLLVAERSAGNPSHINEIQSIIEELREAGYIY